MITQAYLDRERCYRALESKDARFDGRFVTGVTSTGIYCRPSCPAMTPKLANVEFFPTTAAAQRFGLRACKRCRPDATPGSPEWDVRSDLAGRAMKLIADGVVDRDGVGGLAQQLHVGERHLRRLLTEELGAGPLALSRANRAQTARVLIETTELPFAQVAFAAGFSSIRQFNSTVQEVFASSPRELRAAGRPNNAGATEGVNLTVRLPFRAPFAATELFGWLAFRAIGGVAEGDVTHHRRALRLPGGTGWVTLTPQADHVSCALVLEEISDLGTAVQRCRRLLDLDAAPDVIDDVLRKDPLLRPSVKRHRGLRVPGTVDGFETAVFAVLGQQRSVAAARTLAGRIVDRVSASADDLRPFPTSQQLAGTDLDGLGLTGRGMATLTTLAQLTADGSVRLDIAAPRAETRQQLLAISGIGPWTADYIAMRALGDTDISLPGDLVVRKSAEALGIPHTPNDLVEHSAAWRPWGSYAMHYLWQAATDGSSTTKKEDNQ